MMHIVVLNLICTAEERLGLHTCTVRSMHKTINYLKEEQQSTKQEIHKFVFDGQLIWYQLKVAFENYKQNTLRDVKDTKAHMSDELMAFKLSSSKRISFIEKELQGYKEKANHLHNEKENLEQKLYTLEDECAKFNAVANRDKELLHRSKNYIRHLNHIIDETNQVNNTIESDKKEMKRNYQHLTSNILVVKRTLQEKITESEKIVFKLKMENEMLQNESDSTIILLRKMLKEKEYILHTTRREHLDLIYDLNTKYETVKGKKDELTRRLEIATVETQQVIKTTQETSEEQTRHKNLLCDLQITSVKKMFHKQILYLKQGHVGWEIRSQALQKTLRRFQKMTSEQNELLFTQKKQFNTLRIQHKRNEELLEEVRYEGQEEIKKLLHKLEILDNDFSQNEKAWLIERKDFQVKLSFEMETKKRLHEQIELQRQNLDHASNESKGQNEDVRIHVS